MEHLLAFFLIASISNSSVDARNLRSYHEIKQFRLENPCPATGRYKGRCEGYVIDHIKPLACGGLDTPKNMQWQTKEDAKLKNMWELKGCI